jgi:hypothetical protein
MSDIDSNMIDQLEHKISELEARRDDHAGCRPFNSALKWQSWMRRRSTHQAKSQMAALTEQGG